MRKAAGGLKRGSRKKNQADETSKGPSSTDGSSVASNSTNGDRRKATNEEAQLTSKNYRLAKELSKIRVRHRDETKNVTRLTMENMNLASRCREAISHVAMLKKELAMHQKRASEALAMQRQQSQRSSSNVSDSAGVLSELSDLARPSGNSAPSSTDVAVEMDRMDKLMASHAPPPPPPQKDVEEEENYESPRRSVGENDESPTSSQSSSSPPAENDNSGDMTSETGMKVPTLFPHTASPRPKHRVNYNDDYPGDVAPHKASHESSLPSVQDEEDESSEISSNSVSHAREVANMKLSSIDAFEASFDTAFPSSFASPKEGEPLTSEIYNPFFSSPQKKGLATRSPLNRDAAEAGDVGSPEKGRKWGNSVRDRSPVVRKSPTSRGKSADENPNESMPKMPTSGKQPTIEDADEDRSRYDARSPDRETEYVEPNSRMPDPSSSPKIVSRASGSSYSGGASEQYGTPPHFQQKAQEPEKPADQPRRPEKSISASARARYEKALQPRGYHSRIKDPSTDRSIEVETALDSTTEARNSPGTVLRRLQQRRARSERFQPTMDGNSNPIPGIDARRTTRSLRHPPVLPAEGESPFDERSGRKVERKGSGRNLQNGGGSYRSSQNDAENNSYRSRSQTNQAAKKLSPDSMNAEIRALDAMAGSYQNPGGESPTGSELSHNSGSSSASSRYAALKQRRSVKQPVSYAEPALNTKVRRGDVYFPRSDNEDDGSPVAVSPTGSSPEDVSGSQRASRTARSGVNSDEVLKDLGPAVRT